MVVIVVVIVVIVVVFVVKGVVGVVEKALGESKEGFAKRCDVGASCGAEAI